MYMLDHCKVNSYNGLFYGFTSYEGEGKQLYCYIKEAKRSYVKEMEIRYEKSI